MNRYLETLLRWLFDPLVGRIVAVIIALLLQALLKFMHRSMERRARAVEFRYRLHKVITIFGYFAAAVLVVTVFSDYLGGKRRDVSLESHHRMDAPSSVPRQYK